ncbi:hypothetical protein [Myroides sp. N17-2]|uniref:hypothetical protein n=1 Tax=Myroides sp. N17-2 TaxID=2030799 RepID=UPI000EFA37F5|nr:hypothetical protein [Myroides sp. N17-2]
MKTKLFCLALLCISFSLHAQNSKEKYKGEFPIYLDKTPYDKALIKIDDQFYTHQSLLGINKNTIKPIAQEKYEYENNGTKFKEILLFKTLEKIELITLAELEETYLSDFKDKNLIYILRGDIINQDSKRTVVQKDYIHKIVIEQIANDRTDKETYLVKILFKFKENPNPKITFKTINYELLNKE